MGGMEAIGLVPRGAEQALIGNILLSTTSVKQVNRMQMKSESTGNETEQHAMKKQSIVQFPCIMFT